MAHPPCILAGYPFMARRDRFRPNPIALGDFDATTATARLLRGLRLIFAATDADPEPAREGAWPAVAP
jgi:hypothetical protein